MINQLQRQIKKLANPEKAKILQRFFKTAPGEYGEGDKFLGIVVPEIRKLAREFKDLPMVDLLTLIKSEYHEERLLALLILVLQFSFTKEDKKQKEIYEFYLHNTKYINNWDLVDLTADRIVGAYLENKGKDILIKLAKSSNLWEKRIAMLSTFHYIKKGRADEALKIIKILLYDKHDLIHKAVGWMLREIGKRCDQKILLAFLDENYKTMPRTALRYAIEHLPEKRRLEYLKK
jgi:3-methyladenine DNA glycosylase AlkD